MASELIRSGSMISFFGIVHQCGGCGTEALGAVELLRSRGVPVRFIVPKEDPIIDAGNVAADYLRSLGVELVRYEPGMFRTCKVLMSFAEELLFTYIREHHDRPPYLVYSDCMHFVTDIEVDMHRAGYIDEFFFQSQALADRNGPEIARRAAKRVPVRRGYKPFINVNSDYLPLRFKPSSFFLHNSDFRLMRAVRDDPEKWHPGTWRMLCGVTAPVGRKVQIEYLGWGEKAAETIGDPTADGNKWKGELDVLLHTHSHDPKELAALYERSDVLMHICDYTWEEAMSRSMLEAHAAGVVVITDNRGGACELIENGATGFLVDSADEAAFRASQLAFDRDLQRSIASQSYASLVTAGGHGHAETCFGWWQRLIELSK